MTDLLANSLASQMQSVWADLKTADGVIRAPKSAEARRRAQAVWDARVVQIVALHDQARCGPVEMANLAEAATSVAIGTRYAEWTAIAKTRDLLKRQEIPMPIPLQARVRMLKNELATLQMHAIGQGWFATVLHGKPLLPGITDEALRTWIEGVANLDERDRLKMAQSVRADYRVALAECQAELAELQEKRGSLEEQRAVQEEIARICAELPPVPGEDSICASGAGESLPSKGGSKAFYWALAVCLVSLVVAGRRVYSRFCS